MRAGMSEDTIVGFVRHIQGGIKHAENTSSDSASDAISAGWWGRDPLWGPASICRERREAKEQRAEKAEGLAPRPEGGYTWAHDQRVGRVISAIVLVAVRLGLLVLPSLNAPLTRWQQRGGTSSLGSSRLKR